MSSGREKRAREPVNYSEKRTSVDEAPAWARAQRPVGSGKENEPASRKDREEEGGRKKGAAAKAAPERGGRAGLVTLPINDHKQQRASGASKAAAAGAKAGRAGGAAADASMREVTKEVPGLPGVRQKRVEAVPAEADPATAPEQAQSAAERPARSGKQARSGGAKQRKRSAAERQQQEVQQQEPEAAQQQEQQQEPEAQQQAEPPAAKRPRSKSSGKSAGAAPLAAPPASQRGQHDGPQPAGERAGPSASALAAAQPSAVEQGAGAEVLAQAARAAGAAVQAQALAASVPAHDHCERCQHFSDNFAALLREFQGLQREYEELKASTLKSDVEELLVEHNRRVTEHGAKASEVVAVWRAEAEKHQEAAAAAEELQRRNAELERELLTAQEALLERQAVLAQREARIQQLQARNELLERRINLPEVQDLQMQTERVAALSAGIQAPSLQSPGVQMYEARAMAPEGAAGTVYKKGGRRPGASPLGAAPAHDASYTLPHTTYAARAQAGGFGSVQQQQQDQQQPMGDSDMQLTTGGAARLQQPVAGRIAHAAASGRGRLALRPASPAARSPLQPQQAQQAPQPAQAPRQPHQGSVDQQLTAESLMHAPPASAERAQRPLPAAQARARRASAPPAPLASSRGGAPLERQLQFNSNSLGAPPAVPDMRLLLAAGGGGSPLPALAEGEEKEHEVLAEEGQAQTEGHQPAASAPGPTPEDALKMLGFRASREGEGGGFVYRDPRTGFQFELGPATPQTPGCSDEDDGVGPGDLSYRPLNLGSVRPVLPTFLHRQFFLEAKYRHKLMHIILGALVKADPQQ